MKIGILTFHNAYNYGAVLQAYALQNFLIENGFSVEIINYRNKTVDNSYRLFRWRSMPKRKFWKIPFYLATNIYRLFKYPLFDEFVNNSLFLSKPIFDLSDELLSSKDVIIIGSDQLWNKKITGYYDPFYWADFSKYCNTKVISYAVCMNTDILLAEDLSIIKNKLKNFSCISVRENSLAHILQPLTSLHINVSLDPTLMVNPDLWKKSVDRTEPQSPYVLVYAILEKNVVIDFAKRFSDYKHLPLKIMSPIADAQPFSSSIKPSTPNGFLSAIAHASYVITSSFHGLAFSIIYQKDFYVMGNSGKNERMMSLLAALGISDRFIDSHYAVEQSAPIDYKDVNQRLSILRKNSQDYLICSIR